MKRTFAFSSIVHVVFLAVVILPGYRQVRMVGLDVMSVKLVSEERPKPAAVIQPPPPKREIEQPKEEPKKEEPKPKMTYKAKPTEKKAQPKAASQSKKTEKSTPQPSASQTGSKSGGHQVRVDDENFAFAYYLEIIKERVSMNWSPPPVAGSSQDVISTVYFRISREGKVTETALENTSGYDLFDKAAVRAVDLAGPLPPLPAGFKGRWLGVHFEFQRTGS